MVRTKRVPAVWWQVKATKRLEKAPDSAFETEVMGMVAVGKPSPGAMGMAHSLVVMSREATETVQSMLEMTGREVMSRWAMGMVAVDKTSREAMETAHLVTEKRSREAMETAHLVMEKRSREAMETAHLVLEKPNQGAMEMDQLVPVLSQQRVKAQAMQSANYSVLLWQAKVK
ncbi:hypothetical protein HK104_003882 [Borealophlyctis nickersoniae]|nr:hypothetical protein HK104_003882 [Borealophlyctis nickersoniae]